MIIKDQRKTWNLFANQAPQRYFLLLQLGIFLATLIFLLYIITSVVFNTMEYHRLPNVRMSDIAFLFDQMNSEMMLKISVLFVVTFLVNALLGLFFLHRLTGPLVRIRKVLEQMAKGHIPAARLALRNHDYPEDIAKALSDVIEDLNRKNRK